MSRSFRARVIALIAAVIVIVGAVVAIRLRIDQSSNKATPTPGSSTPIVSVTTPPTTAPAIVPTPGATSVAAFGANGLGVNDDTAAFTAAMSAALAGPLRRAGGPSGQPQAVVRTPPGVYRIFQLTFLSNVRMEVDAGAVFEEAGTRSQFAAQQSGGPSLILWDGPPASPLTNVSIVGVGNAATSLKQLAAPLEPGWNVNHSFTFNLDPARAGGDNFTSAMQLTNVTSFVINNVFSIENGTPTDPTDPLTGKIGNYPSPTTSRAAIVMRPRNDSGRAGPYYDPHNGSIFNVYNVGGPYGYGPTQIGSGHNLIFRNIFSRGGTTLRLETDATLKKPFGGELRAVTADTIVGAQCNRAVSFAPHAQNNFDVHVSHVIARNCHQGVVESLDESLDSTQRGTFTTSTLSDVQVVGGTAAQAPAAHAGQWQTGKSTQSFGRDAGATWSVVYSRVACQGVFAKASNPINVDGMLLRPACT